MPADRKLAFSIRRAVRAGRLRRRHQLPFPGRILVSAGDQVTVGQIWCRGRLRSGLSLVDLPRMLRVQPSESRRMIAVNVGEIVDEGTLLAGTPGRMRTGKQWLAPTRGMLSEVSARTGVAVFVRDVREIALYCRLAGEVVAVNPGDGMVVEGQGVAVAAALGAGGRAFGPLRIIESGDRPAPADDGPTGAVLVTPDPLRTEWVRRAAEVRAAGVIAPSADDETLSQLALAPMIVGLPVPEDAPHTPPLPIVLTEGVGHRRMPRALQAVFRAAEGEVVAIVGSRRPGESEALLPPGPPAETVEALGREVLPVRVTAGPDAGVDGDLIGPAPDVGRTSAGAPAECVLVRRSEGGTITVALANLEALA